MEQRDRLEANIWKITAADTLFSFSFIGAIYILFFQYLGYSFADIGIFEAITAVAIIIFDLPTGVLADIIGRKWTVFFANIFMLTMALILGFSSGGVIILILAGLFNGLEYAFKSGAKSALLYDTLKALKRKKDYLKVSGRINAYATVASVIGLLLGAYLFTINPRLPYYIWAVCIGLSLIFIASIYEPAEHRGKLNLKKNMNDMKKSVQFIFNKKKLLWLVLFFLFADVFAESYWDVYSQGHITGAGFPIAALGVLFAVFAGATAIVSYYADIIEKKLGEKKSLYVLIIIQTIILLFIAYVNSIAALVFALICFKMTREYGLLLSSHYENKHIPSRQRASILSAGSFLRNSIFGGAIIIWLFGVSVDKLGGQMTLTIAAGLLLLIGLVLLCIRYASDATN